MISNIEKIKDYFNLPILFNKSTIELNPTIITDLELSETYDISGTPLYNYAFKPTTVFGEKITKSFTKYYTTNITYLKETQKLLKKFKSCNENNQKEFYLDVLNLWDDIKNDTNFKDKYHYLEWNYPICNYLNTSSDFLQIMSIYNLSSPIISLLMPLFIMIIPFFIIQIKGLELTFSEYINILKQYIRSNAIGELITQYNNVNSDKKLYLLVSTLFYFFSIYQNCITCYNFHKNMKKIHNYIDTIRKYIIHTENNVHNLLIYTNSCSTYTEFNNIANNHIKVLTNFKNDIEPITPYKFSFNKIIELGIIMKNFYILYSNKELNNAIMWSFGINGYIESLEGITHNIKERNIKFCKFEKKKGKNVFKDAYYPPLINNNPVLNDIHLHKNLIITGPNASGKTTILKTSLINVILSQQFGCGFYSSAIIKPYKYIHCYLNIPDTSGRDSLFQAEARRCKDIIDLINENENVSHFCVFDELYSGTNPDEAVKSASKFMKYLIKFKNVNCMLTTHFYELCKELDNHNLFENCHMSTIEDKEKNDQFKYTYEIEKGISTVHGGMKVLRDMNYPKEIIE